MKKTEYPMMNTEYPISKWAVALMGMSAVRDTEMGSSRGTRDLLKQHRAAIPSLVIDHSVLDIGYSIIASVALN